MNKMNTIAWAKSKTQILQQLDQNITKIENRLSDSISKISSMDIDDENMTDAMRQYQANARKLAQLKSQQADLQTEFAKYNASFKGYTPTFSGSDFSSSSDSGSSGSSSTKKEIENLELARDRYYDLNKALQQVNNELEKNESLKDISNQDEYIEKEIKLLQQKLELTKKIKAEEIKEADELKSKIKTWFTFDSNGFISNYNSALSKIESWVNSATSTEKENRKEQAETLVDNAERYMDIVNSEIADLDKTIIDTNNDITSALTQQTQNKIDTISKNIEKLESEVSKKLSAIEFKESHYGDYSYSDNLGFSKEKLQLSKTYLQQLTNEYANLNKVVAKTAEGKELLDSAISEVTQKIQQEKLNILELTEGIEKLWLSYYESKFNSKKWQKETQQMNKIELELQVVGEDDATKKMQLMNEKLKLQQSLVSDTEQYLKDLRNVSVTTAEGYGELVNKLMSAEEELYSQQSAVNSLKDSMKQLAEETMTKYIEQLKEIEKLQLDASQERDRQALDSEYFKVSERDFNSYKKSRISSISEEIGLLKNKLAIEGNNSALLDLLKAKQKELLSLEESRYSTINDWYSVQQDMHNFNISKIEEELKALEEKNALEEENETRLEKQNELIELQKELTNIKNNKNIRELQKNTDGSWGFSYTYDKEEYANTEKQYKERQEELAKWEKDLELEKYKEKLQQQKEYEQESLNALKEMYDKQKEVLDKIHEDENKALETKYEGMLENLDKYLEDLSSKFGDDMPKIIETLQVELDKGKVILKDFNDSLVDLLSGTSATSEQKEDFFQLFESKYNDVMVETENFFGKQQQIRTNANIKEILDLTSQSATVNAKTDSNLKTLSDIYKVGWDSIMSNMQSVLAIGVEKIEGFNQKIINSASNAISQINRLQSAYESMQKTIASVGNTSVPDVSALSVSGKVGNTNVTNTINASFPNAKNSSEIEKALNNLSTRAIQYDK